jgi:hypothetical protein
MLSGAPAASNIDEDRVRVVVRARPLLPAERQASSQECVQFVDRRQLFMGKKAFLFDAAFDPLTPQVCCLMTDLKRAC